MALCTEHLLCAGDIRFSGTEHLLSALLYIHLKCPLCSQKEASLSNYSEPQGGQVSFL